MRKIAQAEQQERTMVDDRRGQAELGRVYAYLLARRARRLAGEVVAVTSTREEDKDAVAAVALVPSEG